MMGQESDDAQPPEGSHKEENARAQPVKVKVPRVNI